VVLTYRKRRGVSQKELAKELGLDPTTFSRLERGKGKRSHLVVRKVSSFLEARNEKNLLESSFP
jgi:transcriptional regulator with XRE-family HTH domain